MNNKYSKDMTKGVRDTRNKDKEEFKRAIEKACDETYEDRYMYDTHTEGEVLCMNNSEDKYTYIKGTFYFKNNTVIEETIPISIGQENEFIESIRDKLTINKNNEIFTFGYLTIKLDELIALRLKLV